jgi:hypothetical protein
MSMILTKLFHQTTSSSDYKQLLPWVVLMNNNLPLDTTTLDNDALKENESSEI